MYINKQVSNYEPVLQDYYSTEQEELIRVIPAIKNYNKRFSEPDPIVLEVLGLIESATVGDAFSPDERKKIVSLLERNQMPFGNLQSNYSLLLTFIDNTPSLFRGHSEPGEYHILISSISDYDSSFLSVKLVLFEDFKHRHNVYFLEGGDTIPPSKLEIYKGDLGNLRGGKFLAF